MSERHFLNYYNFPKIVETPDIFYNHTLLHVFSSKRGFTTKGCIMDLQTGEIKGDSNPNDKCVL